MQLLSKCHFGFSFSLKECQTRLNRQNKSSTSSEHLSIIWTFYSFCCPLLRLLGKSGAISQPFVVHLSLLLLLPLTQSVSRPRNPDSRFDDDKKVHFLCSPIQTFTQLWCRGGGLAGVLGSPASLRCLGRSRVMWQMPKYDCMWSRNNQ